MADKWIAECLPCKWETQHSSEQEALHAAETHNSDVHHDTPAPERTTRKMGHVQLRTVEEHADEPEAQHDDDPEKPEHHGTETAKPAVPVRSPNPGHSPQFQKGKPGK